MEIYYFNVGGRYCGTRKGLFCEVPEYYRQNLVSRNFGVNSGYKTYLRVCLAYINYST